MKKLTFILALILILAACGSEGSTQEKPSEADKQKVEEATQTTGTAKKEEKEEKKKEDKHQLYADALKEAVPYMTEEQGTVAQASYDYVVDNANIFPALTDEAIEKVKAEAQVVDLKLLNKNVAPYYTTLVSYEGYVVQIQEENYENGEIASWFNIYDEETGANYNALMYKTSGDILEEDYVQFWGIPITTYSYETLDGGYQNSIFFFASHVEKKH